jgi:hypothetical protein
MKKTLLTTLVIAITQLSFGQTYSSDIAGIVYKKCSACHRAGEIAPFALTNYNEVVSWGPTIKYVTENSIMPPWKADPDYSTLLGENYLTDEEIQKITDWVDNGMVRGDISQEPEFPDFPEGSVLGQPDLVLTMSEAWLHEGNNQDDYRYFVLPSGLTEDKIIKAVEFRPGNKQIVHHALLFEDTTGKAAANDANTSEYGFSGFGSFTNGNALDILNQKQFPGYVPGQKPINYPDGVGQVIHSGADIVAQLHYAPWPVDETDQSTINIFFMDENEETFEREVEGHIMVPLPEVIGGELFLIAPNTTRTFLGSYTLQEDKSLITIAPHMHLLGKKWKIWLEKPNGDIINLIQIPDWDFNWQGSYFFDRYIVAPAGSIIRAEATYDNTISNPNNPSNPPQVVSWGEGTTDEMYYLPIGFVDYRNGDENITFTLGTEKFDSNKETKIYPIAPNPVDDFVVAGFHLTKGQVLNIAIYDITGKKIRTLRDDEFYNTGNSFINFSTRELRSGLYLLNINGNNFRINQKFIKK